MLEEHKAVLILESGEKFSGISFGTIGETIGEVCFNTGMTGYQEILTDPSYSGQIVTLTAPHIGNYGVNNEDIESHKIHLEGLVIKEETIIPSNWRSEQSIGDYLRSQNIVGIKNIDTRSLTKYIRDNGAMNGIISSVELDSTILLQKVKKFPSMEGQDLVKLVTKENKYHWSKKGKYKVAAIDFGIKNNILQLLKNYDCEIIVLPASTTSNEILSIDPDGIFLSNGPGDPAAVSYAIKNVKNLIGKKPIFGICLGHQILALALGAKTFKLKFGHRGINHPVLNLQTKKVEITCQNHGFAVDLDSLPKNISLTHINLNDNTCAGISYDYMNAFSIQYHPESSPGPHDSRYLFEKFIGLMNAKTN